MPNFSTASKVQMTLRAGDSVERIRGENRVKVNRAANCVPPLEQSLADKMGIKINVEWGELAVKLADARRQLLTAHTGSQYFFTVKIPSAPPEYQADWESFITDAINEPIKDSLAYFEMQRSTWSSVVSHGTGVRVWPHADQWMPEFVALADMRFPTDTTLDFKNLSWFARRHMYSPFELLTEAFKPGKGNRWNKKSIKTILKSYKEMNVTDASNNYDVYTDPEKFLELMKQNGAYWDGDAMPAIPLWHFYFIDETDASNKGWFMVVVPETGQVKSAEDDTFLWQDDKPVAEKLSHLLHCQFGDLTADAPFKVAAVRGLGFILLEPTYYRNLTRCRMLQHIHDNFNIWLRSNDPAGKARASIQEFLNMGVVPPGISVIPKDERHQIDAELVEVGMADLKQLMQESSGAYTSQQDTGTKKEQTAFETRVKLEQVNAMMGGILQISFKYEQFAHKEICRRFCLKKTADTEILKFQQRCHEFGIPSQFLDVKLWRVEPVTPLGMGNPTLAQASAQQLLQNKGMFSPSAQQEIMHDWTLVVTGDARKAARWAPLKGNPGVTDGAKFGMAIFGTLMAGVQLPVPEGLSPQEQIDAMMPLLAGKIVQMEKRDNMADFGEAAGLQMVAQYIRQLIQRMATDPAQKAKVKQYSDSLNQLMNQVKGLAQRGAAAQQKQQGDNGEGAKLQTELRNKTIKTKADANTKEAKAAQAMHLKQLAFDGEQRRKDAETMANIHREGVKNRLKAFSISE